MTLQLYLEVDEGGSVADEVGVSEGEEVKEEVAKATKLCTSSKILKINRGMDKPPKISTILKKKRTPSSTPKLSTETIPQFLDPRAPQTASA